MAHTQPTATHVTHPLARAAGVDAAIVLFTIAAATLSFGVGQGSPAWQNIVLTPLVMTLAAMTVTLSYLAIRMFAAVTRTTSHRGAAVAEVLVPMVAMVIAGPMVLIMPLIFLGAVV